MRHWLRSCYWLCWLSYRNCMYYSCLVWFTQWLLYNYYFLLPRLTILSSSWPTTLFRVRLYRLAFGRLHRRLRIVLRSNLRLNPFGFFVIVDIFKNCFSIFSYSYY